VNNIINLFKSFDKYKDNTTEELKQHIEPSIHLNQFKVFEDKDGVYGFVNWAFLNEQAENEIKLTGKINTHNWNSGNRVWGYDVIMLRNPYKIMSWVRDYFKSILKTNEPIKWLRVDKDQNIYKVVTKYKREFHI